MTGISGVWTPVVVATIGAIASVGGSWLTAGNKAKTVTDDRLDERRITVQEVQSQVDKARSQLNRAIERTDSLAHQAASLSTTVQQMAEQVRSIDVRLPVVQKLCSAFTPGNWRDSVIVPKNWRREQCRSFQMGVQAEVWQLGCVYPDHVSWGAENGGVPPENDCDW